MKAIRGRIEDDEIPDGLMLSMRVKLSLVGLCFFLVLGLIASGSAPHYAEALRGLVQAEGLVENQSQSLDEPPQEQEKDESPQEQEFSPEYLVPGDWVTLFFDDFNPPPTYANRGDPIFVDYCMIFVDEAGDPIWGFYDVLAMEPSNSRIIFENESLFITNEDVHLFGWWSGWQSPVGIEMRVRKSEVGGSGWGLWDSYWFTVENTDICPLEAEAVGGSGECNHPLNIDVTEWHTYTILKDVENVTFLVDGEVVRTVRPIKDWSTEPVITFGPFYSSYSQFVEVDYIRIYTKEIFWEDYYELLLNTKEALDEMEGMDDPPFYIDPLTSKYSNYRIDSESLSSLENVIEFDPTSENTNIGLMHWLDEQWNRWTTGGDGPPYAFPRSDVISWLNYFDEFRYAGEVIQQAEAMGIHEQILVGMKSNYEEALRQNHSEDVAPYLQAILDTAQTYFGIEDSPETTNEHQEEEQAEGQGGGEDQYVTLFFEDFDDRNRFIKTIESELLLDIPELTWNLPSWEGGNLCEGYLNINITPAECEGNRRCSKMVWSGTWYWQPSWHQPLGFEVRLRLGRGNNDQPIGCHNWYYWDHMESFRRGFEYHGSGSDETMQGLWAVTYHSDLKEATTIEPITGIDVTQWHTYAVCWDEDQTTFLVDGEIVALAPGFPFTGECYAGECGSYFWIDNTVREVAEHGYQVIGYVDFAEDEWMQIDHYRFFGDPIIAQTYQIWSVAPILELLPLFSDAREIIDKAEEKGIHLSILHGMKDNYGVATRLFVSDLWSKDYGWYFLKESVWDTWEEKTIRRIKDLLRSVVQAGEYFDSEIPEPILLPILGLILLPTLLHRKN